MGQWIHSVNILGDQVAPPEKELWVAVLTRAALDAVKGPPRLDLSRKANRSHQNHYKYDREAARHFFLAGGSHFRNVCEMAGRDPDYVQAKIRKVLLKKAGWNVDVPMTSHYRQKVHKKHNKKPLTGNAYYAAKAGEVKSL